MVEGWVVDERVSAKPLSWVLHGFYGHPNELDYHGDKTFSELTQFRVLRGDRSVPKSFLPGEFPESVTSS